MGAYENPRFIPAPDYTVGLKAFEEKFQKGYEEGMQRGRDLVEQDKNYIAGIEETADQMRLEGEIAIENGLKTKEAVEAELAKFYEKAMRVDKGGKGLGGIFSAKRIQMGDVDIKQELNSFKSAITPLNTMYDKIYLQDYSVQDDEDQSNPDTALKKEIVGAVKAGRFDSGFNYDTEAKGGGFSSGVTYTLPDGTTKEIAGTELARLFGNDTSEDRVKIDERHDEINTNVASNVTAAVANEKSDLQIEGSKKAQLIKPIDVLDESISNVANTAGFYKKGEDGKLLTIQPDANGNYSSVPEIGGELDKLYSNQAMNSNLLNDKTKLDIFRRTVPSLTNVDDDKLLTILNGPMGIGTKRLKNILGDDFKLLQTAGAVRPLAGMEQMTPEEVIKSIHDGQAVTKAVLYHETVKKGIMDKGLINQAYIPPAQTGNKLSPGEISLNAVNEKSQTDLDKVTNVINRIPGNLVGGVYPKTPVPTLDFNTIRRSDAGGNFVTKEVVGQEFDPVTNTLSLRYEQDTKTEDVPTGEKDADGNDILESKSIVNYDTEDYKIHTISGLRKLYEDVLMDATDLDKKTRSTYFEKNIIKTLNQQWQSNENYLDKFDRETHNRMIAAYGGMDAAKKLDIFASRPWFIKILQETQQKK